MLARMSVALAVLYITTATVIYTPWLAAALLLAGVVRYTWFRCRTPTETRGCENEN